MSESVSIELEAERIRELSKRGRHQEALSAAEALLITAPKNCEVLYLVATNQRCLSRIADALSTLQRLEQYHADFGLLYQERGYCYTSLRDAPHAIEAFLHAVNHNPALTASWMMLERLHRMTGERKNTTTPAEQAATLPQLALEVVQAGRLFSEGKSKEAVDVLRAYLLAHGDRVEALTLLARIQRERNLLEDAELCLETVLKLTPTNRVAHLDYVRVLLDQQKYFHAYKVIDTIRQVEANSRYLLSLHAAACVGLGRHEQAIELYRQLLDASPDSSQLHVALGHSLQSVGRQTQAIESYRKAAAIRPPFGDAYWSLANLKTYRFSPDEIAQMRAQDVSPAVKATDCYHLCFALGKAYEDQKRYQESWQFYARGNALKRAECRYDPEIVETNKRKQIEACTVEFFAARANVGTPDPAPIFIVGLPRSGSTLVEQVLASHSQVDGTHELAEIPRIVRGLERGRSQNPSYPIILADLDSEDFRKLGERYITDTHAYRRDKPFFVDKMPNNFRHVGLIHLILPNAKVIDVRREPMACCFSNFKQLFASGQEFTYSMEDTARYYRAYLELMRHWDKVLPGQVLRIQYEDLVEDLSRNVARLLEFCGLDFEPDCIDFYKRKRSVATASSEQVRLPIFREGLSQWRNYEPWLGPLKESLGDALVRYRE